MDLNRDGAVNRMEMIKAVKRDTLVQEVLGLREFRQGQEGHTQFEHLFQEMDSDNDRSVTWSEFVLFFGTLLRASSS